MKNLAFVLSIFTLLLFACNKSEDVQDTVGPQGAVGQTTTFTINEDGQVDTRGPGTGCCCQMVISSTYFGGLTVCGVDPPSATTSCGGYNTTCGPTGLAAYTLSKPGEFCPYVGRPFCVINTGTAPIQFYFTCSGSSIPATWLNPGDRACFSWDCNGTITNC